MIDFENGIQADGSKSLIAGLSGSKVEKLNLGRFNLENLYRPEWKFYPNTKTNKIGDNGAKALAEILSKTSLQWLSLADNDIGDEGCESIAKALNADPRLLWSNFLNPTRKPDVDKIQPKT